MVLPRSERPVTVVDVNWNVRHLLEGCLRSLQMQTFHDFRAMVVDNGSTDGSVESPRERFMDIGLSALPENHGFSRACNVGIESACGECIAMLSNDAEAILAVRDILRAKLDGHPFSEKEKEAQIGEETSITKHADIVTTLSETEKGLVLAHSAHSCGELCGHSHTIAPPETPSHERKDLLFVGGFAGGHPPNTDVVTSFCSQAFPDIQKGIAGMRLHIFGYNPGETVRKLASDSVIVAGFAEDLGEYYERCRVFLARVCYGAGKHLRLVEAMSHGLPAVVSESVASGFGIEDGREAKAARYLQECIEKVIRLYSDEDLWGRVSRASLAFVEGKCLPEIMRRRLGSIIGGHSG